MWEKKNWIRRKTPQTSPKKFSHVLPGERPSSSHLMKKKKPIEWCKFLSYLFIKKFLLEKGKEERKSQSSSLFRSLPYSSFSVRSTKMTSISSCRTKRGGKDETSASNNYKWNVYVMTIVRTNDLNNTFHPSLLTIFRLLKRVGLFVCLPIALLIFGILSYRSSFTFSFMNPGFF